MNGKDDACGRILVVEDHADARLLLRKMLEGEGYEVAEAADGRQGVEEARSLCPDLILMDLHMPEIDGVAATQLIRAMRELCHVPVVALTALDPDEHRRSAVLAGCNDYVVKPPDHDLLLAKVRALLEAGRSSRRAAVMSATLGAG